jgi:hypothetical protein
LGQFDLSVLQIFRRQAFEELARDATETGLHAAWPFIAAGATMIVGYYQGTPPLAYLVCAASISFMAAGIGTLSYMLLWYQLRAINKLKIAFQFLGRMPRERPGQNRVPSVKYGITLENIAMYPIEFKISPRQVSLGANINPNPKRELSGGIVPVGGTNIFWEAAIPISGIIKNKTMEGEYDFKIDYGKAGKLYYSLEKKFRIYIRFGPDGEIISHEISDAPPVN